MIRTLLIFLMVIFSFGAHAQEIPLQTHPFAKIPVLHNGRIKPMESFAKAIVKPITGSNNHATQTLIKMLFNPTKTEHDKIIKVSHSDTVKFLRLEKRKGKRYSYLEIAHALHTHDQAVQSILNATTLHLTPAQKELSHLYEQTLVMRDIMGSLMLFVPIMNIDWPNIPDSLKPDNTEKITYSDLLNFKNNIHARAQQISKTSGTHFDSYTNQEKAIATLSFALIEIEKPILYSQQFKVIDAYTPWDIIRNNEKSATPAFTFWKDAMLAYHAGDWVQWNEITEKFNQQTPSPLRFKIENLYNDIQPFYLAALLYALTILLLTAQGLSQYTLALPAFTALSAGCILHIIGLAMRSYILQRPPVSTLYESILFVGAITTLYGAISFYRNRQNISALAIGAGLGVILYLLAYFNDQSGDTFLMLTAVLNTNFWLATHVLVITAGYAFCLITSGFAHYALIKPSKLLTQNIKKAALWSLLLCTLGTILGGVWADQSWGRFWGWDPKENGALLIILWLIWILHAKLAKQIGETLFHAGLAYLSVIVMLSWFGVNLLSIGLHAYGFTDSALYWLIGFIIAQTALLITLVRRAHAH